MTTFEGQEIFIGRHPELEYLLGATRDLALRRGAIVLIEGGLGAGKSTLIEELRKNLFHHENSAPLPSTLIGRCYAGGEATPYFPFIDALSQFVTEGGKRDVSKLALDLIKNVGPDLLRVIPVLGEAAATTFNIARDFWLTSSANEVMGLPGNMALQFTETIVALAEEQGPLILVLEDTHWGDSASAQLLVRLSNRIAKLPLLILVTYRPDALKTNKAFWAARTEMLVSGGGTQMPLPPFTENEINSFLSNRYDVEVAVTLTKHIADITGGQPLFVAEYLHLLEEKGALSAEGRSGWYLNKDLSNLPIPDGVEAILDDRMSRLTSDESRLLQQCSVHGHEFYARAVAEVTKTEEMKVLEILQEIAAREALVALKAEDAWTTDWTDTYQFSDQLSRKILYRKLTERQRRILHRDFGFVLLSYLRHASHVPTRALIEVGDHLLLGGVNERAAELFFEAANSAFEIGAFNDATLLARRTVSALSDTASDLSISMRLLRAKGIQLQLLSSEMRWWGVDTESGDVDSLYHLLALAEEDALRADDLQLCAQLKFLKAKVTIIKKSLPEAIALFEQAALQAAEAGDLLGEVMAMIELGHHTVGLNLSKGLEILNKAHAKWKTNSKAFEESVSAANLARHLHRLQGSIGVAEFDAGNFDRSESWLRPALDGLRHRRMFDVFSLMSNFLGQLYIAEGRFEEAEKVLSETLEILNAESGAVVHRAYNLALLGKLYLEWGNVSQAAVCLIPAFESTQTSGNEPVLPLIRTYYCELLLHPDYSRRDTKLAESLLKLTIKETSKSGFVRSEVMARVLLARLYTDVGFPDLAVLYSQEAVSILAAKGVLPAVRSEEVWYTHAACLSAQGREAAAKEFFLRARGAIAKKADSISDPAQKYQYWERVPLNKFILAATAEMH